MTHMDTIVLLLHHGVDDVFFEKLLASIRQPLMIEGQTVYLTASLGITRYPHDHVQGDVLLRHANQAMYRAKQKGPGHYVVFDPSMHESAVKRLRIDNDLRRALERDELRVFYQPIVELATSHIVGASTL